MSAEGIQRLLSLPVKAPIVALLLALMFGMQGAQSQTVVTVTRTVGFEYDAYGTMYRQTVEPNKVSVTYDLLGRKTALSDPNLGNWTYTVDPLGQTRRQRSAKLQDTTFTYDNLGRMTRRLEADLDSNWIFDTATKGVGKLAEAYTWAGGVKDYRRVHTYDSVGRQSGVTTSLDWDYWSTYDFDAFARPSLECHYRMPRGGGASAVNCNIPGYNPQGYVSQINRFDGTTTSVVWQGLSQDAEGHMLSEQLGSGLVTQRSYNAYTGRLNQLRSGPGSTTSHQNDSYDYDPLGNLILRTQLVATSGAALSESFTYDDLDRLATSQVAGQSLRSTGYDEIGNIVTKTGVGTYTYPASGAASVRPQAVASISGTVAGLVNPAFSYDNNGNLLTGLARSFTWASYDMPTRIDKLSGATAVQRTEFNYGTEHQRTRQTISAVSGGVTGAASNTIWYAGSLEKEVDVAANTTIVRTMLPLGLGYVEERITGTAVAANASATRNPRYFLSDHLGSTLAVTDQAQGVLQRMSYDAWGRRRNPDGTDDAGALWGTLKNTQDHSGYTGHETLDQLALVHMNARLYDPILGRHTSADPTVPDPSNTQSLNRYSYVLNNALVFVDPTGLAPDVKDKAPRGSICGDGNARGCGYLFKREVGESATSTAGQGAAKGADGPGLRIPTLAAGGAVGVLGGTGAAGATGGLAAAGAGLGLGAAVMLTGDTERTPTDYLTYTRTNPLTGSVYSGRTSGSAQESTLTILSERAAGQLLLNAAGFNPPVLDQRSNNTAAIRGREQQLIDFYGGAQSVGGTSRNMINGVSDWNPNRPSYMSQSISKFGALPDNSPPRVRLGPEIFPYLMQLLK